MKMKTHNPPDFKMIAGEDKRQIASLLRQTTRQLLDECPARILRGETSILMIKRFRPVFHVEVWSLILTWNLGFGSWDWRSQQLRPLFALRPRDHSP